MFSFAFTSVHNNIKSTKVNALINSVISLKKSQFRCFSLKQKPTVIFVLGGPGSGKGTQCTFLARDYGFYHISAGELLRQEIKRDSEDSKILKEVMKSGGVSPSRITLRLLKQEIELSNKNRFIIDGFPRSEENNNAWTANMSDIVNLPFVLYIDCPEQIMLQRLINRGKFSGRSDDILEVIERRIRNHKDTLTVVDHYESKGLLRKVDGSKNEEEVYQQIKQIIESEIIKKGF